MKREIAQVFLLLSALVTGMAALPAGAAVTQAPKVVVPKQAAEVLEKYCQSCHEEGTTKGTAQ